MPTGRIVTRWCACDDCNSSGDYGTVDVDVDVDVDAAVVLGRSIYGKDSMQKGRKPGSWGCCWYRRIGE